MKIAACFLFIISIGYTQDDGAQYLIITHDDYYNALLPLAEWKTQKGLKAKIKKLSEIGSDSTQIRDYVADAYNTWLIKPEYLLLVGANYQLPFPRRAGWEVCHTDNYYTNVTGDFRNEIIPGRFWVSDSLQAKTVVAKVMSYEKYPYMEDSMWFGRGMTIINLDADSLPGDSNYWNVTRYAHSLMINAGFNHIDSLVDAYGYDSIDVINSINNGCSYITYRGEAWGRWYHPFGDIYPTQMSNGYKLPIVVSATCATIDGIGYKWLRAGTPEEPKGIVGFYGTTTGLQGVSAERSALMRGTLTSIFCDSFSTLGQAAEAGRIEYFQLCGDSLDYDGWNCLGDPEMTVRTGTPKIIQVTHPSVCWTGICTVQVSVHCSSVPIESALVCIKAQRDSTIYHYGRTDNAGQIEFIDTLTVAIDSILVTVTARNTKPYCGQIEVHTGIKENQQLQKCNTPFLVVYPNPCRSTMYIEYGLGQYAREDVYLRIYDVTGRLVENIFSGRSKAGMNEFYVEPGKLSTGIYFIKVETDSYEETQKVILVN